MTNDIKNNKTGKTKISASYSEKVKSNREYEMKSFFAGIEIEIDDVETVKDPEKLSKIYTYFYTQLERNVKTQIEVSKG